MSAVILTVRPTRRYWVIRAEGGLYLPHFKKAQVVAIGHLNPLNIGESGSNRFNPNYDALASRFLALPRDEQRELGAIKSRLTQVRHFVSEIQIGDWVICPGQSRFLIGRVSGGATITHDVVRVALDSEGRENVDMKYHLRRSVSWGPEIRRIVMPLAMSKSLRANQTVFNVDAHWEAIYHMIVPFFTFEKSIYASIRINQDEDIDNLLVAKLATFLSEAEVIASYLIRQEGFSRQSIDDLILKALASGQRRVLTKAQFMSEGDWWVKLLAAPRPVLFAMLVYGMIFGNSHLGMDGVIDLQTRQKIAELLLDRWFSKGGQQVVDQLKLTLPNHDVGPLLDAADEIIKL